jgi:hypothetical protein
MVAMGDSDIILHLSVAAVLVIVGAVIAFVIAWRVRKKSVRITLAVLLLAVAAFCGILSLVAALLVAALGVGCLILAGMTPTHEKARPDVLKETES